MIQGQNCPYIFSPSPKQEFWATLRQSRISLIDIDSFRPGNGCNQHPVGNKNIASFDGPYLVGRAIQGRPQLQLGVGNELGNVPIPHRIRGNPEGLAIHLLFADEDTPSFSYGDERQPSFQVIK